MKGALGWVFEGKQTYENSPWMIQINLHSFEAAPTGVIVVISEAQTTTAMFHGPGALAKAHRCMADVLDAIAELSSEAHPEAFDVRTPVLNVPVKGAVNVQIDGRVSDAITAFSAYFGSALKDNARSKRTAGGKS